MRLRPLPVTAVSLAVSPPLSAGTVFVDDAFLGVAGGANLLANPGFESGDTAWTTYQPVTWKIRLMVRQAGDGTHLSSQYITATSPDRMYYTPPFNSGTNAQVSYPVATNASAAEMKGRGDRPAVSRSVDDKDVVMNS